MPKSLTRALSVTALVFATVFGQATQTLASNVGNIIGRVTSVTTLTNKQIEELPLANVNVAAVAPSGTFKALTNAAGYYALTGLPADTYAVSFAKQGYVTVPDPRRDGVARCHVPAQRQHADHPEIARRPSRCAAPSRSCSRMNRPTVIQ